MQSLVTTQPAMNGEIDQLKARSVCLSYLVDSNLSDFWLLDISLCLSASYEIIYKNDAVGMLQQQLKCGLTGSAPCACKRGFATMTCCKPR